VVDLVNRLETESRNGRQGRLADQLTRLETREPGDLPEQKSSFRCAGRAIASAVVTEQVVTRLEAANYDEGIWLKSGDYPAAFYNRALAYADRGDYDHALGDFDVVIRFDANNALALYARGLTLLSWKGWHSGCESDQSRYCRAV
jgi:tetratricopeptide (TPR) repeat protein